MTAVHRHEVPVDDRPHVLRLSGAVLHVASRRADVVDVWSYVSDGPTVSRFVQVFGTGQPLPQTAHPSTYLGTAVTPSGALVWHLFEVMP